MELVAATKPFPQIVNLFRRYCSLVRHEEKNRGTDPDCNRPRTSVWRWWLGLSKVEALTLP
jgi:hypothetical protein